MVCLFTQTAFAVGITGKTKEEVIVKWNKQHELKKFKDTVIVCELVKDIQTKNLQHYEPNIYIITPLGVIEKENK